MLQISYSIEPTALAAGVSIFTVTEGGGSGSTSGQVVERTRSDKGYDQSIACHRTDAIYVLDLSTRHLTLFAEDWKGEALRGPTDVAFAGPNRDIMLAASLDNMVVHRFDDTGVRGLKLNHPKL